jgi:hypothetical protein
MRPYLQVLKPRKLGFTACINLNFLGSNAVAKNKALRYVKKNTKNKFLINKTKKNNLNSENLEI